jgi:hypothetical protein
MKSKYCIFFPYHLIETKWRNSDGQHSLVSISSGLIVMIERHMMAYILHAATRCHAGHFDIRISTELGLGLGQPGLGADGGEIWNLDCPIFIKKLVKKKKNSML